MRRYFRATVSGQSGDDCITDTVVYREGQDPLVLAFRRNHALVGCSTVTVSAPEEAFTAGTPERADHVPTAREIKRKAREEAYRRRALERINDSFAYPPPRSREFTGFRLRFGPGCDN